MDPSAPASGSVNDAISRPPDTDPGACLRTRPLSLRHAVHGPDRGDPGLHRAHAPRSRDKTSTHTQFVVLSPSFTMRKAMKEKDDDERLKHLATLATLILSAQSAKIPLNLPNSL